MGVKTMLKNDKPFTRYHEEKKRDTFTVALNKDERILLEESKDILEQEIL